MERRGHSVEGMLVEDEGAYDCRLLIVVLYNIQS